MPALVAGIHAVARLPAKVVSTEKEKARGRKRGEYRERAEKRGRRIREKKPRTRGHPSAAIPPLVAGSYALARVRAKVASTEKKKVRARMTGTDPGIAIKK